MFPDGLRPDGLPPALPAPERLTPAGQVLGSLCVIDETRTRGS